MPFAYETFVLYATVAFRLDSAIAKGLSALDRNKFTNAQWTRALADGIKEQMSFVIVREADLVSD